MPQWYMFAVLRRLVVVPALLVLACLGPAPSSERSPESRTRELEPSTNAALAKAPTDAPAQPPVIEPLTAPGEREASPSEPAVPLPSEPAPAPLAADEPAAPEPSAAPGPEPGSPESDAELLALLDDSTLTQDEFANAFGSAKAPKFDAEGGLELGASERSRVEIGAATKLAGKPDLAGIEALARGDLHQLEACHAMALRKDAKALGSVVLALEFDDAGKVASSKATSKLAPALAQCLASVAAGWTSSKSAGSKAELPLTLALQAM